MHMRRVCESIRGDCQDSATRPSKLHFKIRMSPQYEPAVRAKGLPPLHHCQALSFINQEWLTHCGNRDSLAFRDMDVSVANEVSGQQQQMGCLPKSFLPDNLHSGSILGQMLNRFTAVNDRQLRPFCEGEFAKWISSQIQA